MSSAPSFAKTKGDERLGRIFAGPLSLAFRVRHQRQNQRGRKSLPSGFVPRDGHTLKAVIPEIETQIGASLARIVADRGYHAPPDHKMKVYISSQKRGVTDAVKCDLRRRSAVEPVIGRAKAEHRMGRNFLKDVHSDAANAALAAAGYNLRRLLAWLAALWRVLVMAAHAASSDRALAPSAEA